MISRQYFSPNNSGNFELETGKKGMRDKIEERREEERGVDYAAVCCPVLWTMFLLFEAFDLP